MILFGSFAEMLVSVLRCSQRWLMDNTRYLGAEFVASGGFAKVYRAFDNWTRRWVAVKELSNSNPELLRRFARERDMLTLHVNNPFVVDIFDSNFSDPHPYLVLEYSDLGSLQKYVANCQDWRRVAAWLLDIAYGLTIIHERGDLVRDIKPSNLLRFRRPNGRDLVKIADFGLGQRPDHPWEMMTTSVFGTKGYIDPVALQNGSFPPASDIYALGITIREFLTGSRSLWNAVPGSSEFQRIVWAMTDSRVENRPTARNLYERIGNVLQAEKALVANVQEREAEGVGWLLAGAAVIVGACVLAEGK